MKLIVAPTDTIGHSERQARGLRRREAWVCSTARSLQGMWVADPADLIVVDRDHLRPGVREALAVVVQSLGQGKSRPVNGPQPGTFTRGIDLSDVTSFSRLLGRQTEGKAGNSRELRDWYRITARNDDDESDESDESSAEVYIYGVIGDSWWKDSVPAATFVKDFDALDADKISVRINSPGGDVYDGITILNAIRRHKAAVTVTVDGIAASAASYIAMGGDEVVMARNSELMIHDASMIAWGDAAVMRDAADQLDKTSNNIASIYAEKAGGDVEAWREAMLAETWYSADEAVEAGLADRVDRKEAAPDDPENYFDLSVFNFAGRSKAPTPMFPVRTAVNRPTSKPTRPAEPENSNKEGSDMATPSENLISGLRERLGFAENVTDHQDILAAVDEALAERADDTTETATNPIPEGSVLVDEATYQQMQDDAAAGREARNQQIAEHRIQVVDQAVSTGRIPPARRQHWLEQLEKDPGAEDILNSFKPGLVPLAANGYTGGVDESTDDDHLYSKFYGDTTLRAVANDQKGA